MMSKKTVSRKLFYQFSLEERVPKDHFLRLVNEAIDFSFVYDLAAPFYSHTGAPSIDPVVIFKMALIGYLYNITSERKLAEEVRLNLAFLWFIGYDIDECPPDHSILSKARRRFGKQVYEEFFSKVVEACREAGLIEGDTVYLDATLVRANASLDSLAERKKLLDAGEYVERLWKDNPEEDDPTSPESPEANPKHGTGDRQKPKANEKWVSTTDPDAALVRHRNKALMLAHKVHLAVDGGRHRIITAVATTAGDYPEHRKLPYLVGQHIFRVRRKPKEVVADASYGTLDTYRFLMRQGILPTIPRRTTWKKARKRREELGFIYDRERDIYICPRGKKLYREKSEKITGRLRYRTHAYACRGCDLKGLCAKGQRCSIKYSGDRELLDRVANHLGSKQAQQSLNKRRCWAETVNADLKNNYTLGRARYRGNPAVHIQALMAACARNVYELVKHLKTLMKHPPALAQLRREEARMCLVG